MSDARQPSNSEQEALIWHRLGEVVGKAQEYVNKGERVPLTLREQYMDLTRELGLTKPKRVEPDEWGPGI